jgi:hypothetical protein
MVRSDGQNVACRWCHRREWRFFLSACRRGPWGNRHFWHADKQADEQEKLTVMARKITAQYRWATLAEDQPFRLSSLAFNLPANTTHLTRCVSHCTRPG